MACSETEDAGGLAPAKDGNEAASYFIRRTLPILDCVDYIILFPERKRIKKNFSLL